MPASRPLRFGVHAGPCDVPYVDRRAYWCEAERLGYDRAEVARFARESQLPREQARRVAIAGSPDEVAQRLASYVDLGFETLVLMEQAPLDYETLRLFIQRVAPRLREGS